MSRSRQKSFFEDRLLNLRHFEREHCSRHSALPCSSEICTHVLKVGRFSISTLTKLTRPGASTQSDKLETVELEGKAYTRDSLSATDLIVGYRMASTLCGELIAWGENRSPSSKLMQVEVDGIREEKTRKRNFKSTLSGCGGVMCPGAERPKIDLDRGSAMFSQW